MKPLDFNPSTDYLKEMREVGENHSEKQEDRATLLEAKFGQVDVSDVKPEHEIRVSHDKHKAEGILRDLERGRATESEKVNIEQQHVHTPVATVEKNSSESEDSLALEKFLGFKPGKNVDSQRLGEMVSEREFKRNETSKTIRDTGLGLAGIGVISGIMAPAVIGLTPALAASLPAFMTSVVTVGGVGLASSLFVVSGAGVAIGAAAFGIKFFRDFKTRKNGEKAKRALFNKEIEELV